MSNFFFEFKNETKENEKLDMMLLYILTDDNLESRLN
jgi:hypothetical protein